jgi:plasmid stabilization system protein ParE
MPRSWSPKRERQYEHIKDSYQERGVSEDEAEERAARTVNKERSEKGETKSRGKSRKSGSS